MRIIGLTGGIGTGKSTVARLLSELGAAVIDMDKVGHQALKPGGEAFAQIVEAFGSRILNRSGEIDRSELGRIVFADPAARKRLNAIIHPVMQEIAMRQLEAYRRQGVGAVVLDAPLLLDAGWEKRVDEVWVTVAPETTVIKRLRRRDGISAADIRARIRSQIPAGERRKQADVIIDTDCPPEQLKARVTELWQKRQCAI